MAPSWLRTALSIMMLCAEGRSTSKNFTIIVAWFGTDLAVRGSSIDPTNYTCSSVNPINGKMTDVILFRLIFNFSNAGQYNRSIELPVSTKIRWTL
jgi:hypothetical protein